MKYRQWMIVIAICMSTTAQAFDTQVWGNGPSDVPVFSGHMQTCFSHAMIGMDSVINARLGVPPEHVVELTARMTRLAGSDENWVADADTRFDEPVLSLMLAAYLWQGSPHSYAVKVFYECAASAPVMAERSDFLP
ncbi:MAG TPA: hypothetical protein ENI97_01820 [Gammaproteobacteria bacterium]|nr:hypothetical protein [Gammaproteobacteria bacterium]